eukprot:m.186305 g.186305  ORF g.186305 m.186305 type:complete len:412 (-) comp16724_c0_seq1:1299-2534(-)
MDVQVFQCPCCGQLSTRLRCRDCVHSGDFSWSRRRAAMHVLGRSTEDYTLRNLRLEVGQRLREVTAHADAGNHQSDAHARDIPTDMVETLVRESTMTYAAKRKSVRECRAKADVLAEQVGAVIAAQTPDDDTAAVEHELEQARARVACLQTATRAAEEDVVRRREAMSAKFGTIYRRRQAFAAARDTLRHEREQLRGRHHGVMPPLLPPIHHKLLVSEKQHRIQQLVHQYALTPESICNISLPSNGNFLHPSNGDPSLLDLGLFHTARFLEVIAHFLCITLPFSCSQIGFPYAGMVGFAPQLHRGSGGRDTAHTDTWNIDDKAHKVNYDICALFQLDGMDVRQLQPEPGSYFQTLPNLVRCTDPTLNPTLGTMNPQSPRHPIGPVIEGPVGEDFVLLPRPGERTGSGSGLG